MSAIGFLGVVAMAIELWNHPALWPHPTGAEWDIMSLAFLCIVIDAALQYQR
jgi:hypothetical protein